MGRAQRGTRRTRTRTDQQCLRPHHLSWMHRERRWHNKRRWRQRPLMSLTLPCPSRQCRGRDDQWRRASTCTRGRRRILQNISCWRRRTHTPQLHPRRWQELLVTMCWQRRRQCLPQPRMLLRTKQRCHLSPRIRARLRAKRSNSRSGRSHPSSSQMLFSLLLLLLLPPNTMRKRKRPCQTNTQRQRKCPILLPLLLLCPPQIALRLSLKLTQHRLMTIPRRKTLHLSEDSSLVIFFPLYHLYLCPCQIA